MTATLLPHLIFGLGGGFGALARHGLTLVIFHRFPLATLVVNIAGCAALGLFLGVLAGIDGSFGLQLRELAFGFCGGFTTFSSFAYQTLDLHRRETLLHAAANILLSLVTCLIAFWLGEVVAASL